MQADSASQQACMACRGSGKTKDADGKEKPCTICNGTGVRRKAGYQVK